MTKLSVRIPFSGFYNTEHEAMLDQEMESDVDYLENDCGLSDADVERYTAATLDHVDWRKCHEAYAREYVQALAEMFEPYTEWEFSELVSPREYNYSNDAIIAGIDKAALENILALTPRETLADLVKAQYTSYSGFHSYYSNDLGQWPSDLAEWKECQLGTLLEAWLRANYREDELQAHSIMESARGNGIISECYQAGWNDEMRAL